MLYQHIISNNPWELSILRIALLLHKLYFHNFQNHCSSSYFYEFNLFRSHMQMKSEYLICLVCFIQYNTSITIHVTNGRTFFCYGGIIFQSVFMQLFRRHGRGGLILICFWQCFLGWGKRCIRQQNISNKRRNKRVSLHKIRLMLSK